MNDANPRRFRRQLETALEAGYDFVPARDLAADDGAGLKLAVTFDDGLRSVAENAAPILAEYEIPWTLFVVSDWADGRHPTCSDLLLRWRDIEELADRGASIGSHSVTHRDFSALSPAEAVDEIFRSREVIRDRTGIEPDEFAIPYGQSSSWTATARAAADEAGYAAVYAQSEDRRPEGTVPRTFITRFDGDRVFRAVLGGAFDRWEEWY